MISDSKGKGREHGQDEPEPSQSVDSSRKTNVFTWYRLGYYDGAHTIHPLDEILDDDDKDAILREAGPTALRAYLRGLAAGKNATAREAGNLADNVGEKETGKRSASGQEAVE